MMNLIKVTTQVFEPPAARLCMGGKALPLAGGRALPPIHTFCELPTAVRSQEECNLDSYQIFEEKTGSVLTAVLAAIAPLTDGSPRGIVAHASLQMSG